MTEEHTPRRMSLSQVVERLTERRGASSSVTLKVSAQGVLMPDVTIAAGTDDEEIDLMVAQAIRAYESLYAAAYNGHESAQEPRTGAAKGRGKS